MTHQEWCIVQQTLDFIKDRLSKYFTLAGISETGNDIKHLRNHTRANMRLMQPWAFAYAANDHTGFQQGSVNNLFGRAYIGWAASHELGHHFDIQGGFILNDPSRMVYCSTLEVVNCDAHGRCDGKGYFVDSR